MLSKCLQIDLEVCAGLSCASEATSITTKIQHYVFEMDSKDATHIISAALVKHHLMRPTSAKTLRKVSLALSICALQFCNHTKVQFMCCERLQIGRLGE
jgi:hypothetical protein